VQLDRLERLHDVAVGLRRLQPCRGSHRRRTR
jgi:hypothetical protein